MLWLRGVLIDFGDTLAYIDAKSDREYKKGLHSILKKSGYQNGLENLSSVVGDIYYKRSKGEAKSYSKLWKLLLTSLNVPSKPHLIRELDEFRRHNYSAVFK